MIVDFVVPVITYAQPQRTKAEKLVFATVTRRVEIPEYTSDEAPLAIRCRFRHDEDEDGNQINFREYRELDNRLLVDLTYELNDGILRDATSMRLAANDAVTRIDCGTMGTYDTPGPPFRGVSKFILGSLLDLPVSERRNRVYPSAIGSEYASNETIRSNPPELAGLNLPTFDEALVERCISVFEEEAAGLAYIDGRLHAFERPPALEVMNTGFGPGRVTAVRRDRPGPLIRYADEDGGQDIPMAFFRIDQAEEALDFARTSMMSFKNEIGDLYVSDSAPVDFNAVSASVHALAVALDDGFVVFAEAGHGRATLDRLTPELMTVYSTLERELKVCDDENVSEELVNAVETFLAMPEEETELFILAGADVEAYRRTLEIWHDRPIDANELRNSSPRPR